MAIARLSRIPNRLRADLKIIRLAVNWKSILAAKLTHRPVAEIKLRNGVNLNSPEQVNLNFLFHEIWIDEFYAVDGYEIKANETVVDIGANIGVFATWAAMRASNVRVLAFEPFPASAEYLRANRDASKLNTCVEFHVVAVAATEGKRTLNVSDSWMLHSLAARSFGEGGVEVDCISLDKALAEIDHCDYLKLDCEGGEYEILYSASSDTISKINRIVCEFNIINGENLNGDALGSFLAAKGFRVDQLRELDRTSGFICARRI